MLLSFERNRVLAGRLHQLLRNHSTKAKKSASSQKWISRQTRDPYTKAAKFQDYKSRAAFKLKEINDAHKLFKPGYTVVDLGFAPGAWSQVAVELTQPNGKVLGVDIIPANPPKGASSIQANILSKKTHVLIRNFFHDLNKSSVKHTSPNDNASENTISPIEESYITSELKETVTVDSSKREDLERIPSGFSESEEFPVDIVISDMYAPVPPPYKDWNNTTNTAYFRMANTSGLIVKDHTDSMNLCDAALILAIDLLKPNGSFVCKFYTGAEDKGLERRLKKVFKRVIRYKPDACRDESKECYFVAFKKKKNIDKVEVFTSTEDSE